jgi:hypothetical protein
MRLTSSAFAEGAMIPRRFTCDDQDLSPPLAWTDVPNSARPCRSGYAVLHRRRNDRVGSLNL